MGIIRNIRRYSWLLTYLFGASPAFCPGFLNDRKHFLPMFHQVDDNTLYRPNATSLRMSEIGYQSDVQASLKICFNDLNDYIEDLSRATQTSFPEYASIGIKTDNSYQQLNDSILQIENEYYSPVRPKQPIRSCEKPSLALQNRGVNYIELRMLDLNMSEPVGISEQQAHFLESFVLFCLLEPSPPHSDNEPDEIRNNILKVAYDGRNPDLLLNRNGISVSVRQWADHALESLENLSHLLDSQIQDPVYTNALKHHQEMIEDPSKTLSAQIISQLKSSNQPFGRYALQVSQAHKEYFLDQSNNQTKAEWFQKLSVNSIHQQQQKETQDTLSFDNFLDKYFNQTLEKPCV